MKTILPLRARSGGRNACVTATCPNTFTSNCWRRSRLAAPPADAATVMPALFTSANDASAESAAADALQGGLDRRRIRDIDHDGQ